MPGRRPGRWPTGAAVRRALQAPAFVAWVQAMPPLPGVRPGSTADIVCRAAVVTGLVQWLCMTLGDAPASGVDPDAPPPAGWSRDPLGALALARQRAERARDDARARDVATRRAAFKLLPGGRGTGSCQGARLQAPSTPPDDGPGPGAA